MPTMRGAYASGWAVDNVKIQVPAPAANYLDFWVFLDDAFEGVTTETTWDYAPLLYGTDLHGKCGSTLHQRLIVQGLLHVLL